MWPSAPSCCWSSPWRRRSCFGTPISGTSAPTSAMRSTSAAPSAGSRPEVPVRYLGVDVGKVVRVTARSAAAQPGRGHRRYRFHGAHRRPYRGLLDFAGNYGAPVHRFGGGSEGRGRRRRSPQGHRYPVIRSAPSNLDVFLSSLPNLAAHAIELVDRFNRVLSDENVRAINATVDNSRIAPASACRTRCATRNCWWPICGAPRTRWKPWPRICAESRNDAAPDIETALANVRHVTDKLADTSDHLDRLRGGKRAGLSRFTRQSLPEFEQLLRESRDAARDFRDLSRSLKQNPSQLLYESNYRGVELPR